MKFYKISKSALHFQDMKQINYNWKYPILIDNENNVYLGNCLKDCLSNEVIVLIIDKNQLLFDDLVYIETKITEENDIKRFNMIESEIYDFIKFTRKEHHESVNLFDFKEYGLITKENFIVPPPYDFTKHHKDNIVNPEDEMTVEQLMDKLNSEVE